MNIGDTIKCHDEHEVLYMQKFLKKDGIITDFCKGRMFTLIVTEINKEQKE